MNEIVKSPEALEAFTQCVTFSAGGTEYAVPILQVKEVIRIEDGKKITRSPEPQNNLEGMINHRGDLISIINLRGSLGKGDSVIDNKTNIVVVEIEIPEDTRESIKESLEESSQPEEPKERKTFFLGIAVESMPAIKNVPNTTTEETNLLDLKSLEIGDDEKIFSKLDINALADKFLPQFKNKKKPNAAQNVDLGKL
jgi:chemotaxis signal transduction protein